MNEPSAQQILKDQERLIHALLDVIIDGKRFIYGGFFPKSAQDRIEKALVDGKLNGYLKETL